MTKKGKTLSTSDPAKVLCFDRYSNGHQHSHLKKRYTKYSVQHPNLMEKKNPHLRDLTILLSTNKILKLLQNVM